MNTSTHYTMKQFDPLPQKQQQQQQKTTNKQTKTVKVSPRLPLTPSNHGSLPSKVLYLQGIHNTCSKHKIIQYLRNLIWHSWHLWLCNLPKIQNKFILILIWSGDNKTQRNTSRERIHAHRYTHRGKRKDVLQCCWKRMTNRARNEFFGTFNNATVKHAGVTKRAGRTSQYDTGWQNTAKRPIFNIPGASSARWCRRGIPKVFSRCGDVAHIGQAWPLSSVNFFFSTIHTFMFRKL